MSAPAPHRPTRSDGEESRERLLQAGLRLFANQGFSKTSTRELAEAACVNVAAISYYYGDKQGLYRAVFFEPQEAHQIDPAAITDPGLSLRDAMTRFITAFLEPLREGERARLCMKLHIREMLEPTGLWEEEIEQGIRPLHEAMLTILCRHFGLARPDDDLQRLAFSLAALGVYLHVGHDVIDRLAPGLNGSPEAIDCWTDGLVRSGLAMIEAEKVRREGQP